VHGSGAISFAAKTQMRHTTHAGAKRKGEPRAETVIHFTLTVGPITGLQEPLLE